MAITNGMLAAEVTGGSSIAHNANRGAGVHGWLAVARSRAARWLLVAAWMALAALAGNTHAASEMVVVGSVDPLTRRVTVFEDLMVKNFRDGGPVQRLYGGFSSASNSFFMVRAGKTMTGACLTEVFQLVRVSGNRLALAVSSGQVWNPNILSVLAPTFDCTSTDCLFCDPGHGAPEFGQEPACTCTQSTGALAGTCGTARPGTTSYGPGEIAVKI